MSKKFKLGVVGDPIEHSLSPQLHNHWIKANKIDAVYEKKKINQNEIKNLICDVKDKKISGINVTVPFKKEVIPFFISSKLNLKYLPIATAAEILLKL